MTETLTILKSALFKMHNGFNQSNFNPTLNSIHIGIAYGFEARLLSKK